MRKKLSVFMAMVMVVNLVAVFATLLPVGISAAIGDPDTVLLNEDFEDASVVLDGTNPAVFAGLNVAAGYAGAFAIPTSSDSGKNKYLKSARSGSNGTVYGPSATNVELLFDKPVKVKAGADPAVSGTIVVPDANAVVEAEFDICMKGDNASKTGFVSIMGMASTSKYDMAMGYATTATGSTGVSWSYGKSISSMSVPSKFKDASGNVSKFIVNPSASVAGTWYHLKYVMPITDSTGGYITGSSNITVLVNGVPSDIQQAPLINSSSIVMDRIRLQTTAWGNLTDIATDGLVGLSIDNINVALKYYEVTPTPPPSPTPEPAYVAPGVYYSENFEGYTHVDELKTISGWVCGLPPANNQTFGLDNSNYISLKPTKDAGCYGGITFAPLPLKAESGLYPGKNAKITAEYKIRRATFSAGNSIWAGFGDSASGKLVVSAGCRVDNLTAGYASNGVYFYYGTSKTSGQVGSPRFAEGDNTLPTTPWVKIKYEITVTDANGNFVTPTVVAYVDDSETAINCGNVLNSVNSIDCLRMLESSNNLVFNIDDVKVALVSDDSPLIDKSELGLKIQAAQVKYNYANGKLGSSPDQYSSAVVSDLNNAILAAQTVYNNPDATQQDLDAAIVALETAVEACAPNPPDLSALDTKITDAETLYATASPNVGTAAGQYQQSVVDALLAGINTAQAVYDKALEVITQATVDAAVTDLQTKIDACVPNPQTPAIPEGNIVITANPFGKAGTSLVKVDVTGIIDPTTQNMVVVVNDQRAKYTAYNGVYKFVLMVDGSVTAGDVTILYEAPAQVKYGDVNQTDNAVDSTDLNYLKGTVSGNRIAASYYESVASDVNGDVVVNSSDLNVLKGFIALNLTKMPAFSK